MGGGGGGQGGGSSDPRTPLDLPMLSPYDFLTADEPVPEPVKTESLKQREVKQGNLVYP